jgi:hypothetical protein
MNMYPGESGRFRDSCYKPFSTPAIHFVEYLNVGTWYLSLAISLFLVLIGLYIHWSVVLLGLLLPFIPMVSFLMMRRAARKRDQQAGNGAP